MEFSAQEEEGAKEGDEENWAGEISIVQNMLIDMGYGIEDCESLLRKGRLADGMLVGNQKGERLHS